MADPVVDITNLTGTLKVQYDDSSVVETMAFEGSPVAATILKGPDAKIDAAGLTHNWPAIYENAGGVSNDFATAQEGSLTEGMGSKQFAAPLVRAYSIYTVDALAVAVGMKGDGSFIDTLKTLNDGSMGNLGAKLSVELFRDGWGHIGAIALNGVSGSTIQLKDPSTKKFFRIGQKYFFAATPTATARDTGATLTLDTISPAGLLTFTAAVSTVSGVSATSNTTFGDYIFPKGNRTITSPTVRKCLTGFDAYCDAGTVHGVDNTKSQYLAGVTVDMSDEGGNIADMLIALGQQGADQGAIWDRCAMSVIRFGDLVTYLQTQKRFDGSRSTVKSASGSISFNSVKFLTTAGELDVMPDRSIQDDRVFTWRQKNVSLISAGSCPRMTDLDGKTILRMADADGYEGRTYSYAQLKVINPGQSLGRLILPPRSA